MISSTALDLPEHRKAVEEACLAAGIFPLRMEHLPARDATGIQVSLEMVDKADIYIGILAFRYGWVPPGCDISITEMEFNRALERKKQGKLREILIFIVDDAHHPFLIKDMEVDELAQQRLEAFKKRAMENRYVAHFKSVADLKVKVGEAFLGLQGSRNSNARNHTSRKRDLPVLHPFFGREQELETIHNDIGGDDSRFRAIYINAVPGMGKTHLAVKAAYDFPSGTFDDFVFVSAKDSELDDNGLRRFDSSLIISSKLDLFNELARKLRCPQITKAPEEERIGRLLKAMKNLKALLILDNLDSLTGQERRDILNFLDNLPQECRAIVTSRNIGAASDTIILEKISQDAALELLANLAKRNRVLRDEVSEAERIKLYEATGGNPLLLRWTAGQLGSGFCRTYADALEMLRSGSEENDPLKYIFGDPKETFASEDEEKLLAALVYLPNPVSIGRIAELSGLEEAVVRIPLNTLANRWLVVVENGEYSLAPMVADFLRIHRKEVMVRTGERLQQLAYAAIIANGGENYQRFGTLRLDWDIVAPALPLFLAGGNDRLQEVCGALSMFLEFDGRWDEWLSLNSKAEAKAIAAGDYHNAGWRAYQVGWAHRLRGQAKEVVECAERAQAHWEKAEVSSREMGNALHLKGVGLQLTARLLARGGQPEPENYKEAFVACEGALSFHRREGAESREVAMALNSLGEIYRIDLKDYDSAERYYKEALELAEKLSDTGAQATYLLHLAMLDLDRGNWPAAQAKAERADEVKPDGQQELTALINWCLAKALSLQGRRSEALLKAQSAFDSFEKLGSPFRDEAEAILKKCKPPENGLS